MFSKGEIVKVIGPSWIGKKVFEGQLGRVMSGNIGEALGLGEMLVELVSGKSFAFPVSSLKTMDSAGIWEHYSSKFRAINNILEKF